MAKTSENPGGAWLRVAEVARLLGVSANTVRRWTDAGRIAAFRSPGGHRRYLADDVQALLPDAAAGGGIAQPGDFAELRRQSQELRQVLHAGFTLTSLLAEAPRNVPEGVARSLCDLTGAPHCDVYLSEGERLRILVSVDGGRVDDSRAGSTWETADWLPCEHPSGDGEIVCLSADDHTLSRRGRLALQRRGCKALAWAPLTSRDELVGAVEITDARARDLSVHAEVVSSLSRVCAEALAIESAYSDLEHRDRALHELMELSQEVAQTHDLQHFVGRFARRLLTVMNADCVEIHRVTGGVIRALISLSRDSADESVRDRVLDTSRYPSLAATLLDQTPLAIASLSDPRLSVAEADLYREWGYASSLTMPLVAGGDIVGLLDLYDDAERDWEKDVEFLTGLCQMVAGLFDSESLLSEARESARLREELVDLGADLSGADAPEDVAILAAARLRRVADCADCDVWWLEEGYLRCLASVDAGGVDETVAGRHLELEHHPSTRQALDEREVLIVSSLDDPRVTDVERKDWGAFGYRSTISVPLVSSDLVVGLIDLFDVRERDYGEVLQFLRSAGRTVADALRNTELLEGLRRGNVALRELVELGDRLNEAETLQDLARAVASRLRSTLHAEDCDIWRVDGGLLRCLASIDSRGWDEEEIGTERELAAYEATVAALTADEPMVIGDLEAAGLPEQEMQAYRHWGFRSMVSVPLVVEGRPIGLIDVFDTRVRDYTGLLDFIRNAGRLLAGSFEKAMLVERLEDGNRDLRVLGDAGMEFGATLDMDAVLRSVSERILEVSQADLCDVYRLDGDDVEILVSVGEQWDEAPTGQRFRLQDYGIFMEAARTRRPVVSLDVLDAPGMTPMEIRDAKKWDYRSCLDIPLIGQGEVIGFISLMNREPRAFEREDVVVGLAQIASQAIGNADLYRELDEQLRRVALVTDSALELANSLDLQETLLATANRLCSSVGVAECEITLVEGDDLRTLMRVDHGHRDEACIGQHMRLADAGVTREVIETKRPAVVGSLRDPRLTPAVLQMHAGRKSGSWATLPLIAKDRVIGTVELVESGAEREFTQGQIETAAAICHAAALAIENARLFEREQATTRENQLLNDMARRTAASLDLDEIVEAAVDELKQLLRFKDAGVVLVDKGAVGRVISSRPLADLLVVLSTQAFGRDFLMRSESERVSLLRLPDDVPLPPGGALAGLSAAAVIALPSETGLLGALALVSEDEGSFRDEDRHLLERVGTQLSLAIKNARLYDEIKQMHLGNLKALSSALNAKDYYTLGHAARVAAYTVMLGRQLGWATDLLESLEEAAYLHDIGKISISDRVLLKAGRLNPQEWEEMRQHPVFSADIIKPLFPEQLVLAVRHHHERYDGNGYPDGLAGEDIPILARGMAVVDAYDAMSCRRPYKAALTYAECLAELEHCRGTQFDPDMVDALLHVLEDVARRRAHAEQIAAEAAARIDGRLHRRLRSMEDEDSAAFREIREVLREVRDANPPTRFLTTHMQVDERYVIGVDPEEDEEERSHLGDEIFADDELPVVLAGGRPAVNTVFADEFGVWIAGLAPIRDADGAIVAAVAADLPALTTAESETLRGDGHRSFAAMLQTAAVRLSRAEIDAITDSLTGLYNHRYLQERLSEELHRSREHDHPLSVLFCDLDHFKDYNDANGHSAGDRVLREVAHVLEQAVRNVDIAGRYGGEEFVLLLVETGRDAALAVAERIRKRVRAAGFTAGGTALTVSIGVASYPDDADRREDLLDKADWAMYLAKRRGRDQVAAFSES